MPIDFYECYSTLEKGRGLGHVTYFSILDPLNISGKAKDRNYEIWYADRLRRLLFKACKIRGQRGRGLGHVTYF